MGNMDTQNMNSSNSSTGEDSPPFPSSDIITPHPHDVLCGRGGLTNGHIGNGNWRAIVSHNKPLYVCVQKRQKMLVAKSIVLAIRSQDPPGRFLKKDDKTGKWKDIGDQKAQEKTSQALREGASVIRNGMKGSVKTLEEDAVCPDVCSSPSSSPEESMSPVVPSPCPFEFSMDMPAPMTYQPAPTNPAPNREVSFSRWPYLKSDGMEKDINMQTPIQTQNVCGNLRTICANPNDPLLRHEARVLTPTALVSSVREMESVSDQTPEWEKTKELSHSECADILKGTTIWGQAHEDLSTLATVAQRNHVASTNVPEPRMGPYRGILQDTKVSACKSVSEEQPSCVIKNQIVAVSRERGGVYRATESPQESDSVIDSAVMEHIACSVDSDPEMQLADAQSPSMPDFTELVRDTSIAMTDMSLSREVSPTTTEFRKALVNARAFDGNSVGFDQRLAVSEQEPNMPYPTKAVGCNRRDSVQGQQKSRVHHYMDGDSTDAKAAAGVNEEEQLEITYLNRGPSLALQDFSKMHEHGKF